MGLAGNLTRQGVDKAMEKDKRSNTEKRRFLNKKNVIRFISIVVVLGFAGLAVKSIWTLQGQVKLKENTLKNLNIELKTVNSKLENLQTDLKNSQESDKANQEKVKALESEKSKLESEKAGLEGEKAELQKQLQSKAEEKARLAQAASLSKNAQAKSEVRTRASGSYRATGSCRDWITQAGVSGGDVDIAYAIIMKESGCNPHARNRSSGAYGIPQSLPASKLASAGSDWQDNPVTQIRWMKSYVLGRYGSWANALAFHNAKGWY